MKFQVKYFTELSANEVYKIFWLRSRVFVVEQNCAYQDVDEKDPTALHLMLWNMETLSAYSRILPPEDSQKNVRIGRVVVHPDFRRKNFGKEIMNLSIKECQTRFPGVGIRISAQSYLLGFYSELGFVAEGNEYQEDGIPHLSMYFKVKAG